MRRLPKLAAALVPCLTAACSNDSTFVDAGDPADSATVDAEVPTGDVTVTTHSRCCTEPSGTLVAGIPVFTVEPGGGFGPSGETDAEGRVTLSDVKAGSVVTAIYEVSIDEYDLVSVAGVQPGDDLVFGERYLDSYAGTDGTMTVNWPAFEGATYYYVYHPCSNHYVGNVLTYPIPLYYYCQRPTADIQIHAYGDAGFIGVGTIHDTAYTNGEVADLASWGAPLSFSVDVSGVPAEVDQVRIYADPVLGMYVGGSWISDYVIPEGGSASASGVMPSGGDRIYVNSSLRQSGDLGRQDMYVTTAGDATSATVAHDEIPWLGDRIFSATAGYATWVQVGDDPYDATVLWVEFERCPPGGGGDDALGGSCVSFDWTLMLPPGTPNTLVFPAPPADLAEYAPQAGDDIWGDVMLVDLSSASGYDAIRGEPEWLFSCPDCGAYEGYLSGTATVSYTGDGGEGIGNDSLSATQRRAPWRRRALAK
jgi:hypothetical protein